MQSVVDVQLVEDDSVNEAIRLAEKRISDPNYAEIKKEIFGKTAKPKKKVKAKDITNIFFDLLAVVLILIAGITCFSSINARVQNACPTFMGYSNMRIISRSMEASGFYVGDNVVVRAVDTDTLKENDIIAFYVYSKSTSRFDIDNIVRLNTSNYKTKYKMKLANFLGLQTKEIRQAAKSNCRLVFHHIKEVYNNEKTGERWFKTYGSSNGAADSWWICENMIVGRYVNTSVSKVFGKVLTVANEPKGLYILLACVLVIAFLLIFDSVGDMAVVALEYDCVQGKRKITDIKCVRSKVGYGMSEPVKLSTLAKASLEDKVQYIDLLWKDFSAPAAIVDYYDRKNKVVKEYNENRKKLETICLKKFKDRELPLDIYKYYLYGKSQIEKKMCYDMKFDNYKKSAEDVKNKEQQSQGEGDKENVKVVENTTQQPTLATSNEQPKDNIANDLPKDNPSKVE